MSDDGSGSAADRGWVADGYNAGYAEGLVERALRDRGVIPPPLAGWDPSAGAAAEAPPRVVPPPPAPP
ncbi:MAG: hypothetical protein F4037_07525, partial [Gemmatimonadales bacterium]|nr:hypothetical protein [Candidatus Palauibacter ramosifaciens]